LHREIKKFQGFSDLGQKPLIRIGTILKKKEKEKKEALGSFQLSDLSDDVQCIYHILTSRVHPVLSHTMITIERAPYLLCTLD
jgi:hypothetical protein